MKQCEAERGTLFPNLDEFVFVTKDLLNGDCPHRLRTFAYFFYLLHKKEAATNMLYQGKTKFKRD